MITDNFYMCQLCTSRSDQFVKPLKLTSFSQHEMAEVGKTMGKLISWNAHQSYAHQGCEFDATHMPGKLPLKYLDLELKKRSYTKDFYLFVHSMLHTRNDTVILENWRQWFDFLPLYCFGQNGGQRRI